MAEILPTQEVQPQTFTDKNTGESFTESYKAYSERYANALGVSPEELRENVHLYDVRPGAESDGDESGAAAADHYSTANFAGRVSDAIDKESAADTDDKSTDTESETVSPGWGAYRLMRDQNSYQKNSPIKRDRWKPSWHGTDGSKHSIYPGAPKKFEPTPDEKKLEEPYGAILIVGEGPEAHEEQVTVTAHLGSIAGIEYVRTKEHGKDEALPIEAIAKNEEGKPLKDEAGNYIKIPLLESLESRFGIDTSRFVLAGIGPALYWKKIDAAAEQSGDAEGVFKPIFDKFTRRHPGLHSVGSRVGSALADFRERHPRLGALVDPASNGSMYNFKEIQERDMQSSRAFYMARPNHPITIWFKSHNYDGTRNMARKQELYAIRAIGKQLQSEIGPMGAWRSIFRPNSLYRRDLERFLASAPGSLGFRAVEMARSQQIANLLHRELTHTQWATSLMNGERLTSRELADFMRYMQNSREYIRRGATPYPRTATAPRVSPHLATA